MSNSQKPILSLEELDAFDPQGPPNRKLCPLCGDSKPKDAAHRSLSVSRQDGLWKCFRCGAKGQAREFWSEKPAFAGREGRAQRLRMAFSLPPVSPKPPDGEKTNSGLTSAFPDPNGNTVANEEGAAAPAAPAWRQRWESAQPLANTPGEAYLRKRGILLEAAQKAQVHFSSAWAGGGAVVFPLVNRAGEVVAVQGRAVQGSAKITYGPKKEGVFEAPITLGARLCRPCDGAVPAIILTEAPIDALSLAQCGFPALALCGTSGPSWLHLACGLRRVALAFDADEAGDNAAQLAQTRLAPFGARCERLKPEDFKDWNEWLVKRGAENLETFLSRRLLGSSP